MAVAFVIADSKYNATTDGQDFSTATFFIQFRTFFSGLEGTPSDSQSLTWNSGTAEAGSDNVNGRIWWASGTGANGQTFGCPSFGSVVVHGFTGITGVDTGIENGAHSTSGTQGTGSVTPSEDNCVLLAAWGGEGASRLPATIGLSFTIPTRGTVQGAGSSYGGGLAYLIQTTAAAKNPDWTLNSSDVNVARIASFKGPGGGGGGATVHFLSMLGAGR